MHMLVIQSAVALQSLHWGCSTEACWWTLARDMYLKIKDSETEVTGRQTSSAHDRLVPAKTCDMTRTNSWTIMRQKRRAWVQFSSKCCFQALHNPIHAPPHLRSFPLSVNQRKNNELIFMKFVFGEKKSHLLYSPPTTSKQPTTTSPLYSCLKVMKKAAILYFKCSEKKTAHNQKHAGKNKC